MKTPVMHELIVELMMVALVYPDRPLVLASGWNLVLSSGPAHGPENNNRVLLVPDPREEQEAAYP